MSFVNSNVIAGEHGPAHILSFENEGLIQDKIYPRVFKQYGNAYGMQDFLAGLDRVVNVPANNHKVVEEYAPEWPLKTATEISTGSAGDPITIVIDSDSLVNNKHLARVGFSVSIPARYQPTGVTEDRKYIITALSETTVANDTLTCEPENADGTNDTASQISTAVPAGTYIAVGYSSFARGAGQPSGLRDFPVTKTYTSHIIAETKGFDGAVLGHEGSIAEYEGTRWIINEAINKAEFSLKRQKEDAIINGEVNDNTALTQTAMSGEDAPRRSTKGIIKWLNSDGQSVWFTGSVTIAKFDEIIESLRTQGVYTGSASIFCSPSFLQDVQSNMNDYIREYSGGSNFLNNAKTELGVNIQTLVYGGMTFLLCPIATFSNPASYGLKISNTNVYQTGKMAIVVPDVKATVNKWGTESDVTIPNMWLGYVNHNGENRRHMVGRYTGMNGLWSDINVASEYDGYKWFWKSEFMLGGAAWNKLVIVREQVV